MDSSRRESSSPPYSTGLPDLCWTDKVQRRREVVQQVGRSLFYEVVSVGRADGKNRLARTGRIIFCSHERAQIRGEDVFLPRALWFYISSPMLHTEGRTFHNRIALPTVSRTRQSKSHRTSVYGPVQGEDWVQERVGLKSSRDVEIDTAAVLLSVA